jgi:hypothetical protein
MSRAVLVLLALLLAAPLAGADHVYSHRFVFEGRLLGSDGTPLANRTVEFFADGDSFAEPCSVRSRPVTDENGDFSFCFHKHGLDSRTEVGVRAGNASIVKPMDTAFRKSVVTLTEPNETGVAPEGWNVTHLVAGRVWRSGAQELEGVRVYGAALRHVPVNLTLLDAAGGRTEIPLTTDGFGDFGALVRLADPADPANVTVEIEVLGLRQTRTLDLFSHRITVGFILPPEGAGPDPAVDVAFPASASRQQAPGHATPPVSPGLVLVILLLLAGALLLARMQRR